MKVPSHAAESVSGRFCIRFGVLFLVSMLTVHSAELSVTNVVNTTIPDDNLSGLRSSILLADLPGVVEEITLSLNISGGFNGDYYAYLSSGSGGMAVLLNRVGRSAANPLGYDDSGFSVTFKDNALEDIHLYGGVAGAVLAGTWQPDGRKTNPRLALDTDNRTSMLSSFMNQPASDEWTLFVSDVSGGEEGLLYSWSISVKTVPEPNAPALIILAGTALLVARFRRSRQCGN